MMNQWKRSGCVLFAAGTVAVGSAWAQQEPGPPTGGGSTSTQLEINQSAGSRLEAADAELNRVYREIRRQYLGQPRFLEKLKLAQRAWIRFRDAELEALFPPTADGDPMTSYGSIYPMCFAEAKERLTRERTAALRQWLDPVPEGDPCRGSRR
jgi:uncharacterized protein YecT (DUF1311 family)